MKTADRVLRLSGAAAIVALITVVSFFAGYVAGAASAVPVTALTLGEASQHQITSEVPKVSATDTARATATPQAPRVEVTSEEGDSEVAPTARPTPTPTPTRPSPFGVFWEAWDVLGRDYYGELPNERQMTYGAIRGVLAELDDQHTTFLDPAQTQQWTASISGSFEGIGASVDAWPDGGVLIIGTFERQPAWDAGLRGGDVILAVDDHDVTKLTLMEAIMMIRGPAGSEVRLRILRPSANEFFDVEMIRARIEIPVVDSAVFEENVAYLRLREFTRTAPGDVETALKALLDMEPEGLILDLRGNPGGLLAAAVDVASFFIDGDILIERSKDGVERRFPADGNPIIGDIPLAVLVDAGSASASEIVAGAIQDSGRGQLVGEQTFGKGSVQTPRTLSDGSMLRVTTSHWFTPGGRAIHGEGLLPDAVVAITPEDQADGTDPQLARAIEIILAGQLEDMEP